MERGQKEFLTALKERLSEDPPQPRKRIPGPGRYGPTVIAGVAGERVPAAGVVFYDPEKRKWFQVKP